MNYREEYFDIKRLCTQNWHLICFSNIFNIYLLYFYSSHISFFEFLGRPCYILLLPGLNKGIFFSFLWRMPAWLLTIVCTGADPNVRDWSGKKPRQYQTNQDTSLSADTYRSEYAREKPSSAAKLLLFSSLPRPKKRVKKNANLSSMSFAASTPPKSTAAGDKHHGGSANRPSSALYYSSALS